VLFLRSKIDFMWQRLSMDSNPAVAAAASKAIDELKSQWRQQDQFFFPYGKKDGDGPESE
jgi:hypothetical protein